MLVFVCDACRSSVIKGRKSYSSHHLSLLLRPDVLPIDPGPHACSKDTVLQKRAY